MDRSIATPPSRNSPCPCGSGLRYKDCHGSLGGARSARSSYRAAGADWAHLDAAAQDACGALMEAALNHQTAGRLDEAARDYREVLERAPDTHDALHMLGVIELGRQRLDEAEQLIRAAFVLRPAYRAIEHNLQLIADARIARMRAQPEELAERALPILAELALAGPKRSSNRSMVERSGTTGLHLIGRVNGDDDDAWLLRRLCELFGSPWMSVWTTDADAPHVVAGARVTTIAAPTGALPRGGVHIYVGVDFESSEWIGRAEADRVLVLVIGAAPTHYLDQLRAIAHDGARRVELVALSPSMAARFGYGHRTLVPPIPSVDAIALEHDATACEKETHRDPPTWSVGMCGQNRRSVEEPRDLAFVRAIAAVADRIHVYDPGRMRYALGDDPRMLFVPREERGLLPFLSPLRCYVHRVDRWWDEGVAREVFTAMALGLPVLCDRASLCADYIDDGVDGLLYGSPDEAAARLNELRQGPSFAESVGRAARAKAARLFDPLSIATAWRKLVHDDAQVPSVPPPSEAALRVAS